MSSRILFSVAPGRSTGGRFGCLFLCFAGIAAGTAVTASATIVHVNYNINITPTTPLIDAYYVGNVAYEDEGDLYYETSSAVTLTKLADAVPANTPLTASGSTALSIPQANLDDNAGADPQVYFADGLIAALYVSDPTTAPVTYGVALSYWSDAASQVLTNESDPDYDASWDGDDLPTNSGTVNVGLTEAEASTALQTGNADTLSSLESGLLYIEGGDAIAKNLLNFPDVTFLDFSSATAGGTGSITQTVVVPEPSMTTAFAISGIACIMRRRKTQ